MVRWAWSGGLFDGGVGGGSKRVGGGAARLRTIPAVHADTPSSGHPLLRRDVGGGHDDSSRRDRRRSLSYYCRAP